MERRHQHGPQPVAAAAAAAAGAGDAARAGGAQSGAVGAMALRWRKFIERQQLDFDVKWKKQYREDGLWRPCGSKAFNPYGHRKHLLSHSHKMSRGDLGPDEPREPLRGGGLQGLEVLGAEAQSGVACGSACWIFVGFRVDFQWRSTKMLVFSWIFNGFHVSFGRNAWFFNLFSMVSPGCSCFFINDLSGSLAVSFRAS